MFQNNYSKAKVLKQIGLMPSSGTGMIDRVMR